MNDILVNSGPANRLRISAIRFLNPAPLMWDFEHLPKSEELERRYVLHSTMPSVCARELADGSADIGLIPVAAYATTPGLAVVPGCAIASLDRVRSILLVLKKRGGMREVKTVAADTSSRTSTAYAQVIFRRFYGIAPEFVPHAPDLPRMLEHADAALVIGDPALLALEERKLSGAGDNAGWQYVDLAHEWRTHTGLPWVSAFWAVRPEALERCGVPAANVCADLIGSRDAGMAHVDDLVAEWAPRIAVPATTIREYLGTNIHYVLDEECLGGLDVFYRYAAETGVLPGVPALRMLAV